MQAVLKHASSRHIRLRKIIYSPQAYTCKQEVISIVCSPSLILRDSIGEWKSAEGWGTKGTFPMYLLFSLVHPAG